MCERGSGGQGDGLVAVGVEDAEHEVLRGFAGENLLEHAGLAAADEGGALRIAGDGYVAVVAPGGVPEDEAGHVVASGGIALLNHLTGGGVARALHAVVELHIGDDDDAPGHLLCRQVGLHGGAEHEVEHCLQVGVHAPIHAEHVLHLLVQRPGGVHFHQGGLGGEGDELILEDAGIALGHVEAQGHGDIDRTGITTREHGAGDIHHGQPVGTGGLSEIIRQGTPHVVQLQELELTGVLTAFVHDVVGVEGAHVHLGFCLFHHVVFHDKRLVQRLNIGAVALAIVLHESLAVFHPGVGGHGTVAEGVVPAGKAGLQHVDLAAEGHEGLAVLLLAEAEGAVEAPGQCAGGSGGGVARGHPLGQQGDGGLPPLLCQGGLVCLQLLCHQGGDGGVQRGRDTEEGEEVIPAAVVGDVADDAAAQEELRVQLRHGADTGAEHLALSLAAVAADIAQVEQAAEGTELVLAVGGAHSLGHIGGSLAQRGSAREKVQQGRKGGAAGGHAVGGRSGVAALLHGIE